MAIATLTEGNKYSTTEIDRAVIDVLTKDSPILMNLQFEELLGNSLTYDIITTDSSAAFYAPGDTWVESTPVITQDTVTLKILGGDADINNFLLATRSNKIDLKGTVIENKMKSVRNTFLDTFYYGTANSEFNGLQAFMTSTTYNTVHAGATTGTALSMAILYEALDLPRGDNANVIHLCMTRKMRRLIQIYLDTIGEKYPTARDKWGNLIELFQNKQIVADDHIVDTETSTDGTGAYAAKTGGSNTTIFAISYAPQAVCGVQGPDSIELIPLGDLETKNAQRYRIRWYCGLKFEDYRSAAKVDGILTTGAVTA